MEVLKPRPFQEDDVDLLAKLTPSPDFMRFSLGVSRVNKLPGS
jgi:hypothetical protein